MITFWNRRGLFAGSDRIPAGTQRMVPKRGTHYQLARFPSERAASGGEVSRDEYAGLRERVARLEQMERSRDRKD